jgi:hypothetical protein
MFWNSEYNALASLPTLFDVFLRDTQRVRAHPCTQSAAAAGFPCPCFLRTFISFSLQLAVAVDANHLISSAQLHVNLPAGKLHRSAAALHCIHPVSLAHTLLLFMLC